MNANIANLVNIPQKAAYMPFTSIKDVKNSLWREQIERHLFDELGELFIIVYRNGDYESLDDDAKAKVDSKFTEVYGALGS